MNIFHGLNRGQAAGANSESGYFWMVQSVRLVVNYTHGWQSCGSGGTDVEVGLLWTHVQSRRRALGIRCSTIHSARTLAFRSKCSTSALVKHRNAHRKKRSRKYLTKDPHSGSFTHIRYVTNFFKTDLPEGLLLKFWLLVAWLATGLNAFLMA